MRQSLFLSAVFCPLLLYVFANPQKTPPIRIDEKAKAVSVPAVVAKQEVYEVLKGAIEYVLVSKGGKAYETLFVTDHPPEEVHAALLKIGVKPGEPGSENSAPAGTPVRILAELEKDGKKVRRPVDELVLFTKTGKHLEPRSWVFTGSVKTFDPEADKELLQCAITKSLVGLHYTDTSPLLQNPRSEAKLANVYKAHLKALPKEGTPVRIVFQRIAPRVAKGTKRFHVFVEGRVQGVGFRAFTSRAARQLGLAGFVKNLRDGRVEAVIEGKEKSVQELLKRIERGPRAAKVKKVSVENESPTGEFKAFKIEY